MTNLSKQTIFTPAVKKLYKHLIRDTLKPRLKFIPSPIWTREIKMYTHFLDFQNIFIYHTHLFEPVEAFCTPSREKKFQKLEPPSD